MIKDLLITCYLVGFQKTTIKPSCEKKFKDQKELLINDKGMSTLNEVVRLGEYGIFQINQNVNEQRNLF